MVKKAHKLRNVLARRQGRDLKLERQRKMEKAAAKRKAARKSEEKENGIGGITVGENEDEWVEEDDEDEEPIIGSEESGSEEDEDDSDEEAEFDVARLDDSDTSESDLDAEDDDDDTTTAQPRPSKSALRSTTKTKTNGVALPNDDPNDEDESDIPLSDLDPSDASSDADIVPHQRLTINNTAALTRALKSIQLPKSTLPFSVHQSITLETPTQIPDANDDFERELALYGQSLNAAKAARKLLLAEGTAFTRPTDYFAEMVKSDEHMGKIKSKLVEEASGKKAAAEARKQRDLKKFGKKVQVEKKQERDREKKRMLEKVEGLKRKRKAAGTEETGEEKMFDVALEDAAVTQKRDRDARRAKGPPGKRGDGPPSAKRQKKDQKFGFGGKKRFSKSGDAASAGDMSGFSVKNMKGSAGKGGKGKQQRPGKSRRAKMK